MRFIMTALLCGLLGAVPSPAAAERLSSEQRRALENYAEKARRLLVHAVYRQPFPGHGKAHLRVAVCRSGKPETIDIRSDNKELRAFVYQHVLVTRFPKPPASFPECLNFGVPLIFHAD